MTALSLSNHGRARLDQRAFVLSDLDLILELGTETTDGVIVLERDRDEAIRQLKATMHRVEKLCSKRLVVRDGVLVTAFHATRRQVRRLVRGH